MVISRIHALNVIEECLRKNRILWPVKMTGVKIVAGFGLIGGGLMNKLGDELRELISTILIEMRKDYKYFVGIWVGLFLAWIIL